MKYVKIVTFVPIKHTNKILKVISENDCAKIGNYDNCSFICKGEGRFLPNKKSNPFIGSAGKLEIVKENRIEFICEKKKAKKVIKNLKNAHPYEEVVVDIYPLLDEKDL